MCVCGVWVYMCRCAHLCICAQTRNSGCSGPLLFPLILISMSQGFSLNREQVVPLVSTLRAYTAMPSFLCSC